MLLVLGLDWEQTQEKYIFANVWVKKLPEIIVLILLTSVITAASLRSCLSLQVSLALSITSLTFPWGSLHPLELLYPFLQVSQIWHCSSDFALFYLYYLQAFLVLISFLLLSQFSTLTGPEDQDLSCEQLVKAGNIEIKGKVILSS